jgi:carbamoyltransferase
MNILGINPSHHGSVCFLQNGEIKYFFQEERYTRIKNDVVPFYSVIDIALKYPINRVAIAPPSLRYTVSNLYDSDIKYPSYFHNIIKNINQSVHKIRSYEYSGEYDFSDSHHICHATHAFTNSGFDEAACIVIDGMGSLIKGIGRETESIFHMEFPFKYKLVYKNMCGMNEQFSNGMEPINSIEFLQSQHKLLNQNIHLTTQQTMGQVYERITEYLGWSNNEPGKTMGLAPYGKFDRNVPPFLIGRGSNPYIFPDLNLPNIDYSKIDYSKIKDLKELFPDHSSNPKIHTGKYPSLKLDVDPKEWHHNEDKITQKEKNIAWRVQHDTQELAALYVEQAIKETGLKKICCSGGYFLNCVANYYLTKRFPDVDFYFEPVANDNGISIGAAYYAWYKEKGGNKVIPPLKSLYLGKGYSKDELLKGISKYVDK